MNNGWQLLSFYIQYYRKAAAVIRELGYPNRHMLVKWFKEYESTGDLHKKSRRERKSKFSDEQKQAALQFYQEHGCSIALTINTLGYPGESTFKRWLNEAFPNRKKHCISGGAGIKCSKEKKEQAVIDLCSRSGSVAEVAQRHGVSRVTLYQWKNQLLNKEPCVAMPEQPIIPKSTIAEGTDLAIEELRSEKVILEKQIAALEKAVYRLQLERDVLERATEVLKKDEGINLNTLRNCEKAEIIGALRKKHRLNELLQFLHIFKSSYYYQANRLRSSDKYAALRTETHSFPRGRWSLLLSPHSCKFKEFGHLGFRKSCPSAYERRRTNSSVHKEEKIHFLCWRNQSGGSQSCESKFPCGCTQHKMAHGHHRIQYSCWQSISFPHN